MRWSFLLLSAPLALMGGCDSDSTGPDELPTVAEIAMTPAYSPVPMGYDLRLLATPFNEEGAVMKVGLTWTSSDPAVATVVNGLVTPVAPGEAEITAEFNGTVRSTTITVVPVPATGGGPALQWTREQIDFVEESWGGVWISDIWGSSPVDAFAVGGGYFPGSELAGEGVLLRYEDGVWSRVYVPGSFPFTRIWGTSASDFYVVGSGIHHFDGSAWSAMADAAPAWTYLSALWGSAADDVYAAGTDPNERSFIEHFDGGDWSLVFTDPGTEIAGLWGSAGNEVIAVGRNLIAHYDGVAWTPNRYYGLRLSAVWGTSATHVFAVGAGGRILHYDGVEWTAVPSPSLESLTAVAGTGESDIFAIGSHDVLHFDGALWRPVQIPNGDPLGGLWVSESDVFVGRGSVIDHGRR